MNTYTGLLPLAYRSFQSGGGSSSNGYYRIEGEGDEIRKRGRSFKVKRKRAWRMKRVSVRLGFLSPSKMLRGFREAYMSLLVSLRGSFGRRELINSKQNHENSSCRRKFKQQPDLMMLTH